MIIKYFAWIKDITKIESEVINNKKIKNINLLKKYLCVKYPNLKKYIEKEILRFAINQKYTSKNASFKNNDEIAIFPPVSGG